MEIRGRTSPGGAPPNPTLIRSTCVLLLLLLYVAATAAAVVLVLSEVNLLRTVAATTAVVLLLKLVEQRAIFLRIKRRTKNCKRKLIKQSKFEKKNGVFQMICSSQRGGTQSLAKY